MDSATKDIESPKIIEKKIPTKDKYLFQIIVAIIASIFGFNNGVGFAWAAPSLDLLLGENSPIPMTANEGSWVVVMINIGTIPSPLLGAYIMDRFGRKPTLIIAAIPAVIHWVLLAFADSVPMIFVARFFMGFSTGMVYLNVIPMYLSEIASDEIRGTIGILLQVLSMVGILFAYTIGPLVSLETMAWISLAPVLLFMILFFFAPESPHYLAGKEDLDGATKSLTKFRGHKDVQDELQGIVEAIKVSAENNATLRDVLNRGNMKSFIIAFTLSFAIIVCGGTYLLNYSQIIFGEIENSLLSPSQSNLIFGVILLIASISSTLVIDRIGRRPLLLISASTLLVSNAVVAIYFTLKQQNVDLSSIAWIPTTMMMVYIFGYGIGLATVTFVMTGEIFPKHIKAGAAAIVAISANGFSIGFLKMCQFIHDTYGYSYTFWMFFFFACLVVPFIWFVVPETKGKSLALILEELNAGNKKK